MELKVGMYVRGSYYQYNGKIGKIIKNYQNELEIAYKDRIIKTTVSSFIDDNFDNNGKQYKASYNVTDLIEIGDYVNGYRVEDFDDDYYDIELDDYVEGKSIVLGNEEGMYRIPVKDIKTIVTKEQFSQIEYRLGDK